MTMRNHKQHGKREKALNDRMLALMLATQYMPKLY